MLLGGVLNFAPIAAQSVSREWYDTNYLEKSDVRITGNNASGLRYFNVDKSSIVELGIKNSNGGFINYCDPDNSFAVNANAESYFRYNPQVVLYGKINYTNLQGNNWGGSAFYDPYYNPFDLVEFSDNTKGKKEQEIYHLIGALSFDATEKFTLGLNFDYKTLNYTKFKDLRHANTMLDLSADIGTFYRFSSLFELGANYDYRRTIEKVGFYKEGVTDEKYASLIDYGGFFGKKEDYPTGSSGVSDGYTRESGSIPMINHIHSLSLQVNLTSSNIRFFNDLIFKTREGYYGEKSSSKIYYTEHNGNAFAYKASLSLFQEKNRHTISAEIYKEDIDNYETSPRRITSSETGSYYYEYYDPVDVGTKSTLKSSAVYTYWHNINNYIPDWGVSAAYNMVERKSTAIYYPYYRKQNIRTHTMSLSGERNIIQDKNQYRISLGASYQLGNGNPMNDGFYAMPNETAKKPSSLDHLVMKEFEYLTADQVKLNIGLYYSRPFPTLNIKGYAALDYSYTNAFDTEYMSSNYFHEVSFKVGCFF
ncbi:hypothetical protein LJB98_02320 [Bacteroidales bacterium OttesenSCG-928-M11]|nr:hypothetical protein [Bacteroidales bacterium OttesenSCG-928-M11]